MRSSNRALKILLAASTAAAAFWMVGTQAYAQTEPAPSAIAAPPSPGAPPAANATTNESEIVVTARKRPESILRVPVIENVISAEALQNAQVTDITAVSQLVPGLSLGQSALSIGTQVSLRGVGTSSLDAGIDQSVALNIDGLQFSQGLAYRAGVFDLAQVEVLKGPQSLFYGKNSPGGVIALTTADPTSTPEIIGRVSHEFESRENREELIVSGPVTDTLALRLAASYADSDGWFYNRATAAPFLGGADPAHDRFAPDENYIIRGTAVWTPSSVFRARLKLNHTHDFSEGAGEPQMASCPDGATAVPGFDIPFIGGGEDCRADRTVYIVDLDPGAFPTARNGGRPFLEVDQDFGTLELTYHPTDALTLTSTTGYARATTDTMINGTATGFSGPALAADNHFTREDATQELRLDSDFQTSPINFTLGAYTQWAEMTNRILVLGNTALTLPVYLAAGTHDVKIHSESVFGQLRWRPAETLEFAVGARVTDENRSDTAFFRGAQSSDLLPSPLPTTLPNPDIGSSNWSPEATITYTPTDDLTLFAAYKEAYKSGSFSITIPEVTGFETDNSFGDEHAHGGEVGVKSRLFDRTLFLDAAAYYYLYDGLQVGTNVVAAGGLPQTRTLNAGSAEVYGVDLEANYTPPAVENLTLHASVNWNHARFSDLQGVPCWGGQTIAEGCNQVLNTSTGLFTAQDLSGIPLVRAPEWQANVGADYEMPIGDTMRLRVGASAQYSSRYLANLGQRADFYQQSYTKLNANLAISDAHDRWEVALIGSNLNNELSYGNCINGNYQNGQVLGGEVTGGTTSGPAGVDEVLCYVDPGREVTLRLTVRPDLFR